MANPLLMRPGLHNGLLFISQSGMWGSKVLIRAQF